MVADSLLACCEKRNVSTYGTLGMPALHLYTVPRQEVGLPASRS